MDSSRRTPDVQIACAASCASLHLKSLQSRALPSDIRAEIGLPEHAGAASSGATRALCVGPGEWLVISNEYEPSELYERIARYRSRGGFAVVDVSDGLQVLDVRGEFARELLSRGCGLDLHPLSFPATRCARTRLAQIAVIIECCGDPARFSLYVARSYADYLHSWLTDAAVGTECSRSRNG